MAYQSIAVSGSPGGSNNGAKARPKINRVRTGCLTCRRRRKKCDETRPACKACIKTNVVCEGYPARRVWGTRSVGKKSDSSKSSPVAYVEPLARPGEVLTRGESIDLDLMPFQEFGTYDEETFRPNDEATQWFNLPNMPQISPTYSHQHSTSLGNGTVDNEYNDLFPQANQSLGFNDHFVLSTPPISPFSSQQGTSSGLNVRRNGGFNSRCSSVAAEQRCIPPELPFLISGLESSLHKRLFYHFTRVMSKVLTTTNDDSNPMTSVVTPLALADSTLMQTLLSLAGAHLLKLQPGGASNELSTERYRLHKKALNAQTQRMQALKEASTAIIAQLPNHERDATFATSLLLCLCEICEGSADDGFRLHLGMAREFLSYTSTATLDPFLLEFFLYHDAIAQVTAPSSTGRLDCSTDLPNQTESVVGVQDGLLEYVTRISSLRCEAGTIQFPPKYDTIEKGLEIWEDLFRWKPKVTPCKDRELIAQIYQWALFIWLFSIIYPDGKSDPAVQGAVKWMTVGIGEIKSGQMACLLFPLFIVGSAAIRQEDRETVAKHFKRLRAYSSLGNVDLTFKVVEKMWEDHDAGLPRSWDWVMHLKKHGMNLLPT